MDFLKNLLNDESCNVDGTVSATNPVSMLVSRAFEGNFQGDEELLMQMNMSTDGGGVGHEERIMMNPGAVGDPMNAMADGSTKIPPGMDQSMQQGPMGFSSVPMEAQQMQMQMMHMQQMQQMQMQMEMQMQQMRMMGMEKEQQDWAQKEYEAMRHATHEEQYMSKIPGNREEGLQGAENLDQFWDGVQDEQKVSDGGPSKSAYREEWKKLQERLEGLGKKAEPLQYKFLQNNPYLENAAAKHAVQDDEDLSEEEYFKKGLALYQEGNIHYAIFAFEAGVQKRPENDECWRYLGSCHAENDEDKEAIVCLQKAIDCDPYNLNGLLSLGTCFVNELDSENALKMLRSWVTHNPRFHGLNVAPDMYSDGTLMDEVMQLVLAASKHAPSDVDVKVLMGVLYNVSSDFESASMLLSEALQTVPGDYNILNKLGATLANNNKSEEAIPLYKQALAVRPTFTRGWLNLGISYANLNKYEDAAKAYLQSLHLNPKAKHIWGYLRVVLTCLGKLELVELCGKEDMKALAENLGVSLQYRDHQPIPDMTAL